MTTATERQLIRIEHDLSSMKWALINFTDNMKWAKKINDVDLAAIISQRSGVNFVKVAAVLAVIRQMEANENPKPLKPKAFAFTELPDRPAPALEPDIDAIANTGLPALKENSF